MWSFVAVQVLCIVYGQQREYHSADIYSLPVPHGPFVSLEHVNVNVWQWSEEHEIFFSQILNSPRDPRSTEILQVTNEARAHETPKMSQLYWFNIGLQQFHLPVADNLGGETQQIRGEIVLAWPKQHTENLYHRLVEHNYPVLREKQNNQNFHFRGINNLSFAVEATETSTWFGPASGLGTDHRDTLPGGKSEGLGIRALRFHVPINTSHRICRFYQDIFGAHTSLSHSICIVHLGFVQALEYIETDTPVPRYDGHHLCLYLNFNAFVDAYHRAQHLIFHNPRAPQFQYSSLDRVLHHGEFRFKDIIDLDTNEVIYEMEHEIRSLRHPGFLLTHRLLKIDENGQNATTHFALANTIDRDPNTSSITEEAAAAHSCVSGATCNSASIVTSLHSSSSHHRNVL